MDFRTAIERLPRLNRRRDYLCACNRWERYSANPDLSEITAETVNAFRDACVAKGLSAATIETSCKDLVRVAKWNGITLDRGRPLRLRRPSPFVPRLDDVARVYAMADQASWPKRPWCSCRDWWRALLVVAVWTAFRRGDLARLTWDDVADGSIATVANKTGWTHRLPMCATVQRHLMTLDQPGRPERIFDLPRSTSYRACRDQFAVLCCAAGVRPVLTLQQLRRLSITSWSSVSAEAGRIVHGSGLGVLGHYLDQRRILDSAAPRFPWPAVMRLGEPTNGHEPEDIFERLRRATPETQQLVSTILAQLLT